ncbi:MAG: hypothetical protein AAFQ43_03575, partial [Bacteroidota bacterium]
MAALVFEAEQLNFLVDGLHRLRPLAHDSTSLWRRHFSTRDPPIAARGAARFPLPVSTPDRMTLRFTPLALAALLVLGTGCGEGGGSTANIS